MEHKFKEDLRVVDFPVAEPSPVTENLTAAKKLLEQGWCQGSPRVGDSYCILGALYIRTHGNTHSSVAVKASEIIRSALPGHPLIHKWNDKPGRTKSEVLSLMDRAIATSIIGS